MPRIVSRAFLLLVAAAATSVLLFGCAAPKQAAPTTGSLTPTSPGTPQGAGGPAPTDASGGSTRDQMRAWVQSSIEGLGVGLQLPIPQGVKGKGVPVATVKENTPAKRGGMRAGDIVVSFNGKTVTSPRDLAMLIGEAKPSTRYPVIVARGGKQVTLQLSGVTPSTLSRPAKPGIAGMQPGGMGGPTPGQ